MGDVLVKGATLQGGRVEKLHVHLHNLPDRVIDRDTALTWMREGHSMVPFVAGQRLPALQLVAVGEDETPFIRVDNAPVPEDALPDLPPAA